MSYVAPCSRLIEWYSTSGYLGVDHFVSGGGFEEANLKSAEPLTPPLMARGAWDQISR